MPTKSNDGPAEQAFARLKDLVFPDYHLRQMQWDDRLWTTGGALVQSLVECLSHGFLGKPGEVKSWLLWYTFETYTQNPTLDPANPCQADSADPGNPPEQRLGVALALVFCAELALRHRAAAEQELGPLLFSLRNGRENGCQPPPTWFDYELPDGSKVSLTWLEKNRPETVQTLRQLLANEDWVWGCIRTLQGAPVLGSALRPALCAPVVGVDLKAEAMVHTLVVEVLNQGAGKVFRHPCDAFDTEPALDTQFSRSMRMAFTTALAEVNKDKSDPERILADGRWRLLHRWKWNSEERGRLPPLAAPNGASASGAAARAWWFAMSGKVLDDRVVVIAQVNDAGQFVAVDDQSIGPKLEAVIQTVIADAKNDSPQAWQHFDTVGVVDDNLGPAREVVEAAVRQGRIHEDQLEVVDLAHPEVRRSRVAAAGA